MDGCEIPKRVVLVTVTSRKLSYKSLKVPELIMGSRTRENDGREGSFSLKSLRWV